MRTFNLELTEKQIDTLNNLLKSGAATTKKNMEENKGSTMYAFFANDLHIIESIGLKVDSL